MIVSGCKGRSGALTVRIMKLSRGGGEAVAKATLIVIDFLQLK